MMRFWIVVCLCLLPQWAGAVAITNLTREPQAVIIGTLGYRHQILLAPGMTYREVTKPLDLSLAGGTGIIHDNDGDSEYAIWPQDGGRGARLGMQRRVKSHRGDGIF